MHADLQGWTVVITRPAGTASALARQVRARGGRPLLLPGLALHVAGDVEATRTALRAALQDEVLLFSSPAAVRYAAALLELKTDAPVFAVGQGTARALRRHGLHAQVPSRRQDSEGLLELPALQQLRGRRVALIGADGGRGVLREQLRARGARLREVHVYCRLPARLDRRHHEALQQLPAGACVLLSSAEALANLQQQLPPPAWRRLSAAVAVVSSERLATAAATAGFAHRQMAASALPADLLAAAAMAVRAFTRA
jgi:uroporphyrinogen-III synthase